MTGFHDLLRKKLPFPLMLLARILISTASLVTQSMHQDIFGQNTGVLQLDMMALGYAVLRQRDRADLSGGDRDMPVVQLDPHIS
jgi:hypothetical protein